MMFDCHHDKKAVLVLAEFPTATGDRQNTDPGEPQLWWVSDNTGAILSETHTDGTQVYYPTEQDAWDGAYLISVLGKTTEDIQLAAYYLWEAEGRPDGEALANWIEAKGNLEAAPQA